MALTNHTDATESLQIQRWVPAPPERVFSAWTNPDELKKWWGPKGVRCRSAEVELRVGGQYRIENELPDGSVLWIVGEFEAIERPRLLIYTWSVDGKSPMPERVTVRFESQDNGTEVTLKHDRITPNLLEEHLRGWISCIDGIIEYFAD